MYCSHNPTIRRNGVRVPLTRNWHESPLYVLLDSLCIAPTQNSTHFIEVGFLVAGGGLYFKGIYHIKKGNCKKKNKFYSYKKIYYIFKNMVAIPCGCNSTSTVLLYNQ